MLALQVKRLSDGTSIFRPIRVGLVGFDEVTALHLVGPADAFVAASLDDGYGNRIPCYEVQTLGVFSDWFRAEDGLMFEAQATLSAAPILDTIVIAGGRGIQRPEVSDKVATWILKRVNDTRRIGAVSTGIYGVAPTGLLDGREVTTHWRFARDLAQRFPRLKIDHRRAFVRDGPYYTTTGLSGGVNLSLAMIQEDYGPYVAQSRRRVNSSPYQGRSRGTPIGCCTFRQSSDRPLLRPSCLGDPQSPFRPISRGAGAASMHVSQPFQQSIQECFWRTSERLCAESPSE
ncbi:MAG: hypothetical protein DME48_13185 [Verrucomicrobia bacterium]|nr:MAG: hypothetical protein DME48_13185 [Verrucomicrobiota bacterium]